MTKPSRVRGGGDARRGTRPPRSTSKKSATRGRGSQGATSTSTPSTGVAPSPTSATATPSAATNATNNTTNPTPTSSDAATEISRVRRIRKRTSKWWIPFDEVIVEGSTFGQCKQCVQLIKANSSSNGTTGLKNHHQACEKKRNQARGQTILNYQPGESGSGEVGPRSSVLWKFDQKKARTALAIMIIMDEQPSRFVEREGLRDL